MALKRDRVKRREACGGVPAEEEDGLEAGAGERRVALKRERGRGGWLARECRRKRRVACAGVPAEEEGGLEAGAGERTRSVLLPRRINVSQNANPPIHPKGRRKGIEPTVSH
jgi:hypothetical protein